jgi:hypothetical protein
VGSLDSDKAIVETCIAEYRPLLGDKLRGFQGLSSRDAVIRAGHGQTVEGKCHLRPRRLSDETSDRVVKRLQNADLAQHRNFESLPQEIENLLGSEAGPLVIKLGFQERAMSRSPTAPLLVTRQGKNPASFPSNPASSTKRRRRIGLGIRASSRSLTAGGSPTELHTL